MSTFVSTTDRGRALSLIKLDNTINGATVYMDITKLLNDADSADRKRSYYNGGPARGIEMARAKEYADWTSDRAGSENLHEFCTKDYVFFLEGTRNTDRVRVKSNKASFGASS